MRNVRKDNEVEEDGVGEVWALVFAPSLVDVVETSECESSVQDPEALGDRISNIKLLMGGAEVLTEPLS